MTNFEKIKAMSVEEMASFLNYSVYENEDYHTVIDKNVLIGLDDVIDWLESEVEDNA